jgi:thymidylate synthase (FAD)
MGNVELYGDGIGYVELVDHLGSDLSVVNSARVSFGSHKTEIEEQDEKLINYLIKHRHSSTLEHNVITFRFKVPLFIRSQHHRHRTWSYNEISRRYTDFNIEFYEPKSFRTQHKSNRQASKNELINPKVIYHSLPDGASSTASQLVKNHNRSSLRLYEALLDSGVCREQARGVLPQNMYTEYYGTANLNNIFKFIDLRTHEGAQWEIQQVALAILKIIKELYPITVKAYMQNGR